MSVWDGEVGVVDELEAGWVGDELFHNENSMPV